MNPFQYNRIIEVFLSPLLLLILYRASFFAMLLASMGVLIVWVIDLHGKKSIREDTLLVIWGFILVEILLLGTDIDGVRYSLWNLFVLYNMAVVFFLLGIFLALQHEWLWLEFPNMTRLMERLLFAILPVPFTLLVIWLAIETFDDFLFTLPVLYAMHLVLCSPKPRSETMVVFEKSGGVKVKPSQKNTNSSSIKRLSPITPEEERICSPVEDALHVLFISIVPSAVYYVLHCDDDSQRSLFALILLMTPATFPYLFMMVVKNQQDDLSFALKNDWIFFQVIDRFNSIAGTGRRIAFSTVPSLLLCTIYLFLIFAYLLLLATSFGAGGNVFFLAFWSFMEACAASGMLHAHLLLDSRKQQNVLWNVFLLCSVAYLWRFNANSDDHNHLFFWHVFSYVPHLFGLVFSFTTTTIHGKAFGMVGLWVSCMCFALHVRSFAMAIRFTWALSCSYSVLSVNEWNKNRFVFLVVSCTTSLIFLDLGGKLVWGNGLLVFFLLLLLLFVIAVVVIIGGGEHWNFHPLPPFFFFANVVVYFALSLLLPLAFCHTAGVSMEKKEIQLLFTNAVLVHSFLNFPAIWEIFRIPQQTPVELVLTIYSFVLLLPVGLYGGARASTFLLVWGVNVITFLLHSTKTWKRQHERRSVRTNRLLGLLFMASCVVTYDAVEFTTFGVNLVFVCVAFSNLFGDYLYPLALFLLNVKNHNLSTALLFYLSGFYVLCGAFSRSVRFAAAFAMVLLLLLVNEEKKPTLNLDVALVCNFLALVQSDMRFRNFRELNLRQDFVTEKAINRMFRVVLFLVCSACYGEQLSKQGMTTTTSNYWEGARFAVFSFLPSVCLISPSPSNLSRVVAFQGMVLFASFLFFKLSATGEEGMGNASLLTDVIFLIASFVIPFECLQTNRPNHSVDSIKKAFLLSVLVFQITLEEELEGNHVGKLLCVYSLCCYLLVVFKPLFLLNHQFDQIMDHYLEAKNKKNGGGGSNYSPSPKKVGGRSLKI